MVRILRHDLDFMETLEDYRVLTTRQAAHIQGRTLQMARRRLHALRQAGLVESTSHQSSGKLGRPESLFFLSERGADVLHAKRPDSVSFPCGFPRAEVDLFRHHQLLLNWFRIHLARMSELLPALRIHFFPTNLVERSRIHSVGSSAEQSTRMDSPSRKHRTFIPDGVFTITVNSTQKTLLFFLEVDMGTRPVASRRDAGRDIHEKISNYQQYFKHEGYKAYEPICGREFLGFRLLFLTNTAPRLENITLLLGTMTETNFVWTTTEEMMFARGLADAIWVVGGNARGDRQSIVGSQFARSSTLPSLAHTSR